jgi:hypothetical protein
MNGGDIPPLSHTSSCRGAQLIKHRDNITCKLSMLYYINFVIVDVKLVAECEILKFKAFLLRVFTYLHAGFYYRQRSTCDCTYAE